MNARWIIPGVATAAVAVIASVLLWSPRPRRPEPVKPAVKRAPTITLVNLGKDEAALTDPTPLFLPTEWNAGQSPVAERAGRAPGIEFAGYPAKLKFAESDLSLDFPAHVVVPSRPADALANMRPGPYYLGRGGQGTEVSALPPRKGFVEVRLADDGEKVLSQVLTDAAPPTTAIWHPIEFLVAVNAAGIVGPPVLTESSTVAGVDGYFQTYLAKTLRIGERLSPGFYRISVGP